MNILKQKIVTARKLHYCTCCNCQIMPNEKYEYSFGIYEGEPNSSHLCLDCKYAIDTVLSELPIDEYTIPEIVDAMSDYVHSANEIPANKVKNLAQQINEIYKYK